MKENYTNNLEESSAKSIPRTIFRVAVLSNRNILHPLSFGFQSLFSGGGVCSVVVNQRLVISSVLLIFCNGTREQEVVVSVLYFRRKISSLASSVFMHFFVPYTKHVHSLNRTIIGAVIVELTPIS